MIKLTHYPDFAFNNKDKVIPLTKNSHKVADRLESMIGYKLTCEVIHKGFPYIQRQLNEYPTPNADDINLIAYSTLESMLANIQCPI